MDALISGFVIIMIIVITIIFAAFKNTGDNIGGKGKRRGLSLLGCADSGLGCSREEGAGYSGRSGGFGSGGFGGGGFGGFGGGGFGGGGAGGSW